jgi:DNA-binding winged helix-turn-helix (wHTH) protein/tetratricopeptide (TPR) repeat protein
MIYAFRGFELDTSVRVLRRDGRRVEIAPKVFSLIELLIERRSRFVSKRDLLDTLWPDEVVVEAVISNTVHRARAALGQQTRDGGPILTVYGRGYRFQDEVLVRSEAEPERSIDLPHTTYTSLADAPFVGREAVLAQLGMALRRAASGAGTACVLVGAAGIGKTRSAEVFARAARSAGASVWAGCSTDADGAPALWPWIQVLRSACEELESGELAGLSPGVRAVIRGVVPDLLTDDGAPAGGTRRQASVSRFHVFDCVARFLVHAGRSRVRVLVLDDLQNAGATSIELLQFLVPLLSQSRVLLVGTFRQPGAGERASAVSLHALRRFDACELIELRGLGCDDIATYVERLARHSCPLDLAETLHERTGGNPFFVRECMRLLLEEGGFREDAVDLARAHLPAAISDALRARLEVMDRETLDVLRVASVLGAELDLVLLGDVAGLPPAELLDVLDRAVARGAIARRPDGLGGYAFAHPLIRETLYADLPRGRAAELHARVAAILERSGAETLERLRELAHHSHRGLPICAPDKVVEFSRRAADAASRLFASKEAADLYALALDALDYTRPADDALRLELLSQLGRARVEAGSLVKARSCYEELARAGRLKQDPRLLARAALGLFDSTSDYRMSDPSIAAVLEEALALLPTEETALRARVLARLSSTERYFNHPERRRKLIDSALALVANGSRTPPDLLSAKLQAMQSPDEIDERIQCGEELLRHEGTTWKLLAQYFLIRVHVERGDMEAADRLTAAYRALAHRAGHPTHIWRSRWGAMALMLAEGRFDQADAELEALGSRAWPKFDLLSRFVAEQVHHVMCERGRFPDDPPPAHEFGGRVRTLVRLTRVYAETGRLDEARRLLAQLARDRFAAIPRAHGYLYHLTDLSVVASMLHDVHVARELYGLLSPYAALNAVSTFRFSRGSVAHFLGVLAHALGDMDEADAHFSHALELNTRMRLPTAAAWTRVAHARLLLERSEGSCAVALGDALDVASRAGMLGLLSQARRLPQEARR